MWVKDLAGIIGLVQLGTLEFHIWGSRVDRLEYPDRIAFDFDPAADVSFERVVKAAFDLRKRLAAMKLASFAMSTGGKGLHVIVPIERRRTWDEVRSFAWAVATSVVKESPNEYVAEASLRKRKGKIFVDYLRNGRGATAIGPYSTRARDGATVAAPLRWEELKGQDNSGVLYNIESMINRVAKMKSDPWADYGKLKQRLTDVVMKQALKGLG
jgi:bifunctional non-homologous end joining protein LigD